MDIRRLRRLTTEELDGVKALFKEKAYQIIHPDGEVDGNDMSLQNIAKHSKFFLDFIPEASYSMIRLQFALYASPDTDPITQIRAPLGFLISMAKQWGDNMATIAEIEDYPSQELPPDLGQLLQQARSMVTQIEAQDTQARRAFGLITADTTIAEPASNGNGGTSQRSAPPHDTATQEAARRLLNLSQPPQSSSSNQPQGQTDIRRPPPDGRRTGGHREDPQPSEGKFVYDSHGQMFRVKSVDAATLNIPKVQFILLAFDKTIRRNVLGLDLEFQWEATLSNLQEMVEIGSRSFFSTNTASPTRRTRETLARRLQDFVGAPALTFKAGGHTKNKPIEAILGQNGALREANFSLSNFSPEGSDMIEQIEGFETIMWALTASQKFRDSLQPFKTAYMDNPQGLRSCADGILLMTFSIQNVIIDWHRIMTQPMRYDTLGYPTVLSDGHWTHWLTTRCTETIEACWTRSFLVQEFVYLPWYAANKVTTPPASITPRNPRRDPRQGDDTPPRPNKRTKKEKTSVRPKATVTPAPTVNNQPNQPSATQNDKRLCFRTVAIGLGVTTYSNDSKPALPARNLLTCKEARPNGNCPGDHSGWQTWTKASTRAAIVHLHDAGISMFLADKAHDTFYKDLLAAVDNSTLA